MKQIDVDIEINFDKPFLSLLNLIKGYVTFGMVWIGAVISGYRIETSTGYKFIEKGDRENG